MIHNNLFIFSIFLYKVIKVFKKSLQICQEVGKSYPVLNLVQDSLLILSYEINRILALILNPKLKTNSLH